MKNLALVPAIVLAIVVAALAAGQGAKKGKESPGKGKEPPVNVEQQLKQMEDDWLKALKNKDAEAFRTLLAEDWMGTDEKGKLLTREAYIAQMLSNPDVIEANENFDMKMRIIGDTAIVTGGLNETGKRNGKMYADLYRWTDIFMKRGGRWQPVASQWVKIP